MGHPVGGICYYKNFFQKFSQNLQPNAKNRTYRVKGLLVHTKGVNNMDDLQIIELYFARDEQAIKETDRK